MYLTEIAKYSSAAPRIRKRKGAAERKHRNVCEFLLYANANLSTVLITALRMNHIEVAQYLIELREERSEVERSFKRATQIDDDDDDEEERNDDNQDNNNNNDEIDENLNEEEDDG